jgi:hypothetical protein
MRGVDGYKKFPEGKVTYAHNPVTKPVSNRLAFDLAVSFILSSSLPQLNIGIFGMHRPWDEIWSQNPVWGVVSGEQ